MTTGEGIPVPNKSDTVKAAPGANFQALVTPLGARCGGQPPESQAADQAGAGPQAQAGAEPHDPTGAEPQATPAELTMRLRSICPDLLKELIDEAIRSLPTSLGWHRGWQAVRHAVLQSANVDIGTVPTCSLFSLS